MNRFRTPTWWYWLSTTLALLGSAAGWAEGAAVAMALTVASAVHLGVRARSPVALPVQLRIVYLGLLVIGAWRVPGVHVAQIIGTAVVLVFDYCLLGRMVSLLPWNRRGRLTRARMRATFLRPPVTGSIAAVLDRELAT